MDIFRITTERINTWIGAPYIISTDLYTTYVIACSASRENTPSYIIRWYYIEDVGTPEFTRSTQSYLSAEFLHVACSGQHLLAC